MEVVPEPRADRPRLLLITPPASYRTVPYLEAARRLGIEPLLASPGRHALVTQLTGGLQIDLSHGAALRQLLAANRERPFAGVVATDDQTVELASRVAAELGLPHNPPGAARLSRRKDLARARLAAAGVPVPEHRVVSLDRPLRPQLQGLAYPVVLKPVSLSGSRGVIRADDRRMAEQAVARIAAILQHEQQLPAEERNRILVERFVPGEEVALEGLLHRGRLQVLALFDKPDPLEGPFFEETYYVTPSRHSLAVQGLIGQRVAEACRAYGLQEGPVHAELRLHRGDAWIMEVASRTIGGYCGRLLRFGAGQRLEELVIARAVDRPLTLQPEPGAAGVLMIPVPGPGILRRVEGLLAARRVPGVEEVDIAVREGYRLVPLPEGASYLGFIFARADTPAAAEAALRQAHGHLNFVTAPVLAIA